MSRRYLSSRALKRRPEGWMDTMTIVSRSIRFRDIVLVEQGCAPSATCRKIELPYA